MAYIDKLILKRQKQQNTYVKLKSEYKDKELEPCTFKPKVNEKYEPSAREEVEGDSDPRKDRWEKLYRIGIQTQANRKDKPKDDLEVELHGQECSFRPDLTLTKEPMNESNKRIKNDIYNEKSYELLYNRIKRGRMERQIKEAVHNRSEFPPEVNEYLNRNKVTIAPVPKSTIHKPKREYDRHTPTKSMELGPDENLVSEGTKENNLSGQNNMSEDNDTFNVDPDKKDVIPLLIIDVNIRPGVKKKIYVFDGDTAEGLAEKFSKEHSKYTFNSF